MAIKKLFNIDVIPELATAIPRRSYVGLLIFNTAVFIGKKETPGIEITIASKRYEPRDGEKRTWFRWQNWGNECQK